MLAAGVVALAGLAGAEGSRPGSDETPTIIKGADVDLLQSVRALAGRVESLRGLRFAAAPVAVRASASERMAAVEAGIEAALPADRLAARGRAWRDIGWESADAPARLARSLGTDLEGMTLPPGERRLLVDTGRLTEQDFAPTEGPGEAGSLLLLTGVRPDEPLAAHYLVHALERASSSSGAIPETTDALLARAAWSEGTANLVALLLLFQGIGLEGDVIQGKLSPARVLGGALVPQALTTGSAAERSLLFFVYEEGFAQTAALFRRGGWPAVADAVRARTTTRDLLHPDKAPAPATALAEPELVLPDGYRIVDRDVLGEQAITTLVSIGTGKDNLGLLAGDGWLGDLLVRFEEGAERAGESGVTVWSTRWASADDAEDFRYGLARAIEGRARPVDEGSPRAGTTVYRLGDRVFRLVAAGTTVTVRNAPAVLDVSLERMSSPPKKGVQGVESGSRPGSTSKN